jgi:hypothetical protein
VSYDYFQYFETLACPRNSLKLRFGLNSNPTLSASFSETSQMQAKTQVVGKLRYY